MHRRVAPALFFGLTTLFSYASASFGFTSASFDYVQLSSPQVIAWNGQWGEVELRVMRYPADQESSYLPIAANLTGNSYTWVPISLAPSSQWTLEAIDGQGNIAASETPFTIQAGAVAATSSTFSTSLMEQNPQSTPQPTTLETSSFSATAKATSAATFSPSSTNTPIPTANPPNPTSVRLGIFIGVILGVAGIVSLITFFILRHRQKRGKSLVWNSFRLKKRSNSSLPFDLQDNASMETLSKPMELQGSHIEGTSETSWGSRMELGLGAASRKSFGGRISIAEGAVETSMGKRIELG